MYIILVGSKTYFGKAILLYLLQKTNHHLILPNGIPSTNPRVTALSAQYKKRIHIKDKIFVQEKAELLINAGDKEYKSLKESVKKNTLRSCKWLRFFQKCKNARKYIYISSAFVNFHRSDRGVIKEKIYEQQMQEVDIIDILNEGKTSPHPYHNSYLYTKQLSEIMLERKKKKIELGIFRPSLLMPAVKIPYCGWGACHTLTNILLGIGTGLIPCWNISREDIFRNNINSIPIDLASKDCISMIDASGSEIRHCCFTGNNPHPLSFYTFFFYTFEAYRYFQKTPLKFENYVFKPYYPTYLQDHSLIAIVSVLWRYIWDLFFQRKSIKQYIKFIVAMIRMTRKGNHYLPYLCSKKLIFERKRKDSWFLKKYPHNKSFKMFIENMQKDKKITF